MKKLSILPLYESITKKNKTGSMIAHYLPFEIAKDVRNYGNNFKGDAPNIKDMHITLGLLNNDNLDRRKKKEIINCLKLLSQYIDPFETKLDKFEVFPASESNENHDVLVGLPNAEHFDKIHSLLFDIFNKFKIPIDNGDFEFKPHVTIKYCKPGQNIDVSSMKFDKTIPLDAISFAKSGKIKHFKLGHK